MRNSVFRLVGIFLTTTVCVSTITSAAVAQTSATDLSLLVVDPSILGDDWSIASQQQDGLFRGFSPPETAGYVVEYAQSPQLTASVALYEFPNHAGALASLSDPYFYWGHGNTTLAPLTGLGDAQSFRAYGVGKGPNSGITFVHGPVVVYISAEDDAAPNTDGVDAICDALAAAEDALLEGALGAPTPARPSAPASPGVAPSALVASLATLSGLSDFRSKFPGPMLLPPAGLQPFDSFPSATLFGLGYGVAFFNPDENSPMTPYARIEGAMTRKMYDSDAADMAKTYTRCSPSTAYCAQPNYPCTSIGCPSQGEIFRGLKARGADAYVEHTTNGVWNWDAWWFDSQAGVSYRLTIQPAPGPVAAFDKGLSPDNRAGAEQFAALADKLVPF